MKPLAGWALLALAAALPAGCCGDCEPAPATVVFVLDAPLCSSRLPMLFSIDSVPVGADTFSVNLAPEHTTSRGFPTTAGLHRLGAQVVGGFVWADTLVTLEANEVFLDTLPFYCS